MSSITKSPRPPHIVNVDEVADIPQFAGEFWGQYYKPLTPTLDAQSGRLGANLTRLPPGRSGCPFHTHQREDEVFYVLSGRGVLRYGESVEEIGAGDCIACAAGTGIAHQIANPFDEDLVYLAIGRNDPDEVCTYPDSGKVMVRSLKTTGFLRSADYLESEPERPRIFDLVPPT